MEVGEKLDPPHFCSIGTRGRRCDRLCEKNTLKLNNSSLACNDVRTCRKSVFLSIPEDGSFNALSKVDVFLLTN